MDSSLANGLISILNGFGEILAALMTPVSAAVAVIAAGLIWLARCEVEELNRQTTKPTVRRH